MSKNKKTIEESVDASRREFVEKALKSSAFAVPLALSIGTISSRNVYAQTQSVGGAGDSSGGGGAQQSGSSASVPEPAAITMLGLGLAALALQARRKQKLRSKQDS